MDDIDLSYIDAVEYAERAYDYDAEAFGNISDDDV